MNDCMMPLIEEVSKYGTVSVVGVDKNTGKTECLNYLLRGLAARGRRVAVTSVGVDGERVDQVSLTAKPEITLTEGTLFSTSEKHYRGRQLVAEVLDVSRDATALGRVVTARVLAGGKVLLSGPSSNAGLRQWTKTAAGEYGAEICLIDGALSRLSPASPALSQAMVLATGAAYSASMDTLVRHTRFVCDLVDLGVSDVAPAAQEIKHGVWALDDRGGLHDLGMPSAFAMERAGGDMFAHGNRFYVAGALGGRFLRAVMRAGEGAEVVVPDFTHIFVPPELFREFTARGGRVSVLQRTRLIAVCVNPFSPRGYGLDADELRGRMERSLGVPVYDIRKEAQRCG